MHNWYLISPECSAGMENGDGTIEGMYIDRRILPIGSMVPLEWKGRQRIRDIYLPAHQLMEYEPEEEDWAILYMLWPAVRPDNSVFLSVSNNRIGTEGAWASGWYRILEPDPAKRFSSVPWGVSALCNIEGICQAGQLAMVGDIVPAAFFSGLSPEQFDRLETIGLCSAKWLATYEQHYRAEYLRKLATPVMERIGVSLQEREVLYAKFPAMRPASVDTPTIVKQKKSKGR